MVSEFLPSMRFFSPAGPAFVPDLGGDAGSEAQLWHVDDVQFAWSLMKDICKPIDILYM